MAHFLVEAGHFGNATGIVGDRAEGVERDDHAGEGQHRGHGEGDAEQAREVVGDDDADDDDDGRKGSRLERDGEALDDVGAVAGDRGFRDRVDRAAARAGVVFGDDDDEARDDEAGNAAPEQAPRREGLAAFDAERGIEIAEHPVEHRQQHDERKDARRDDALVEGAHDVVVGAEADEIGADDRGDHARAADGERQDHAGELERIGKNDGGEHHGGNRGHHIGFEEVGRHAGAIADIVAHVVGNGRRVARIIFRDAGFDLAHHVAADIGTLGEDAAAETGEDRDQRGAEARATPARRSPCGC